MALVPIIELQHHQERRGGIIGPTFSSASSQASRVMASNPRWRAAAPIRLGQVCWFEVLHGTKAGAAARSKPELTAQRLSRLHDVCHYLGRARKLS